MSTINLKQNVKTTEEKTVNLPFYCRVGYNYCKVVSEKKVVMCYYNDGLNSGSISVFSIGVVSPDFVEITENEFNEVLIKAQNLLMREIIKYEKFRKILL